MDCDTENGEWVTVKDPNDLKPGDRVRFTDHPEHPITVWIGALRLDPRYISDDPDCHMAAAELLDNWKLVQALRQ